MNKKLVSKIALATFVALLATGIEAVMVNIPGLGSVRKEFHSDGLPKYYYRAGSLGAQSGANKPGAGVGWVKVIYQDQGGITRGFYLRVWGDWKSQAGGLTFYLIGTDSGIYKYFLPAGSQSPRITSPSRSVIFSMG